MYRPMLSHLPVQVLQNIAIQLPPASFLALLSTCRYLYNACNDSHVWCTIVAAHLPAKYVPHINATSLNDDHVCKPYVVALVRATQCHTPSRNDVQSWLPHTIALHYSLDSWKDSTALEQLYDRICSGLFPPTIPSTFPSHDPSVFETSLPAVMNMDAWYLAQATAFCLSARSLASVVRYDDTKPPTMLESVPCELPSRDSRKDMGYGTDFDPDTVLHVLANRAVGFFYTELCWALNNGAMATESTAGLLPPPTTLAIPFPSFLRPPLPFTLHGLQQFSTCHLPAMVEPSFFVDDEWTGYTSSNYESKILFDGIGGDNPYVSHNGLDQLPNDRFPFRVERTIRFRLVQEWDSHNRFLLQSNCFQSQTRIWMLNITVNKRMGDLKLSMSNPLRYRESNLVYAMMTPFGIVGPILPQGHWIWLWKCEWSGVAT
ncbi:hypothetical protein J1614_009488 [Plenodomus biglobosus]|nr:hypothetical protein J1614_009488 [Plenodomus biglobosus]